MAVQRVPDSARRLRHGASHRPPARKFAAFLVRAENSWRTGPHFCRSHGNRRSNPSVGNRGVRSRSSIGTAATRLLVRFGISVFSHIVPVAAALDAAARGPSRKRRSFPPPSLFCQASPPASCPSNSPRRFLATDRDRTTGLRECALYRRKVRTCRHPSHRTMSNRARC